MSRLDPSHQHLRPRVAIILSTGPTGLLNTTLARRLSSAALFLLPALRSVADVDTYACIDSQQPASETELLLQSLQPRRVWTFDACGSFLLPSQQACCMEENVASCPDDFKGKAQFFRLGECYRRVASHVGSVSQHTFYVRLRPDLQWVGSFDARILLTAVARRQISLRYRSCAGVDGLTLGHLQMAWYKVGPDACGEARWQTDYSCFTVDDQFAVVPASLAERYFTFAQVRARPSLAPTRPALPAVRSA